MTFVIVEFPALNNMVVESDTDTRGRMLQGLSSRRMMRLTMWASEVDFVRCPAHDPEKIKWIRLASVFTSCNGKRGQLAPVPPLPRDTIPEKPALPSQPSITLIIVSRGRQALATEREITVPANYEEPARSRPCRTRRALMETAVERLQQQSLDLTRASGDLCIAARERLSLTIR